MMRKLLRGMGLAVAVDGVLLVVVAYLMTNPAKARPFAPGLTTLPLG